MVAKVFRFVLSTLLLLSFALISFSQPQTKRNDRPPEAGPTPQRREENKKPPDPTRYAWEFRQPEFPVSHILIEHDASGRGKITFEHRGEATPSVETTSPSGHLPLAHGRREAPTRRGIQLKRQQAGVGAH